MTANNKGFSLLEVMVAMAILAGSLTWLIVGFTRNISAENRAKLMTSASFLARQKISEFEDELYEKGFGEFERELNGTFEDRGFSRFTWSLVVDKVELPSQEQLQIAMTKANEARTTLSGQDPSQAQGQTPPGGANPSQGGAGALSSQFGIIKDVLEQGIRRVTVKVMWKDGRKTQDVTVVGYFTDPRKVDQAIQLAAAPAAGGAAGGGTPGGGAPGGTGR